MGVVVQAGGDGAPVPVTMATSRPKIALIRVLLPVPVLPEHRKVEAPEFGDRLPVSLRRAG